MAEYESQTICDLIESINSNKLVLPAIQRNFVWTEQKVCDLFDSIMRDYPIGTFLFWNISAEQIKELVFNKFLTYYVEQRNKNSIQKRERINPESRNEYIGVLDGQQRITSIYIGITGFYRMHKKGKRWGSSGSYEDKYLCLDVFHTPEDEEDKYHFGFIIKDNQERIIIDDNQKEEFWVPVSKAYEEEFEYDEYTDDIQKRFGDSIDNERRISARKMLKCLTLALRERKTVNYYPAKKKDLAQVVEIFVRVNSGGVKLAASDLMLSVASGASCDEDIQIKMQEAIDRINEATSLPDELAFKVDKELILTAGLLFIKAEKLSLMYKDNYSRSTMERILEKWDAIVEALYCTCIYIEKLGFIGSKLTSKNLILPIAYYFYINRLNEDHYRSSTKRAQKDRVYIRQWLLRAMINSIFRDGTGSTLLQIRSAIDESNRNYFPLDVLMNTNGAKSLIIDDYETILDYSSNDGRTQPLLMELAKADIRVYHCDHIWPRTKMSSIKKIEKAAYKCEEKLTVEDQRFYMENYDKLPNLQILDSLPNQEKSAEYFDVWLERTYPDTSHRYYDDNFIPKGVSYSYTNFRQFFNLRKDLLLEEIKNALPADFNAIVERYKL